MIKRENIKKLLKLLDYFSRDNNVFIKRFEDDSSIKVDLKSERIYYPKELKVNDKKIIMVTSI